MALVAAAGVAGAPADVAVVVPLVVVAVLAELVVLEGRGAAVVA
ncbi:hypothetical protein [Nonomuraea aridisoli]|nr:hypothetical protein [Nonomuraea aridisoli]